jgi:hypothetical protein
MLSNMIYFKTDSGLAAFAARAPELSGKLRTLFILFDGVKTAAQVLQTTAGLGIKAEDLEYLAMQGFIQGIASSATEPVNNDTAPNSNRTPQERYRDALPLATKATSKLGLRGFHLNLAVERASGYEDLLALLPRIEEVAGKGACAELEAALLH